MGAHYRDRRGGSTASTTSQDLSGLTGVQADTGNDAPAEDERTLAELREAAEAAGLPTYGTKAELRERLAGA